MDDGCYVYCVVAPERRPPPDLVGLEDRAVRRLTSGPVALWVSELDARPSPSLERIRRHNEVVEAAMTESDSPVPMRFGQWFASRTELLEEVGERRESYARALESFRGAVELGVRVVDPARAPARDSPGTADPGRAYDTGREYMEELRRSHAEERSAEEAGRRVAEELAEHLGPVARRQRVETLPPEEGLVSLAHLVAREDEERYRRKVAGFGRRRSDLRLRVSGPWPPYSFAE